MTNARRHDVALEARAVHVHLSQERLVCQILPRDPSVSGLDACLSLGIASVNSTGLSLVCLSVSLSLSLSLSLSRSRSFSLSKSLVDQEMKTRWGEFETR